MCAWTLACMYVCLRRMLRLRCVLRDSILQAYAQLPSCNRHVICGRFIWVLSVTLVQPTSGHLWCPLQHGYCHTIVIVPVRASDIQCFPLHRNLVLVCCAKLNNGLGRHRKRPGANPGSSALAGLACPCHGYAESCWEAFETSVGLEEGRSKQAAFDPAGVHGVC